MLVAAAAAPLPLFVRSFVGLSVRSRCAVSRWSTPSQLATNSINHHRTHRPPPTRPHTRKPSRDTQHTRTHARTDARTDARTHNQCTTSSLLPRPPAPALLIVRCLNDRLPAVPPPSLPLPPNSQGRAYGQPAQPARQGSRGAQTSTPPAAHQRGQPSRSDAAHDVIDDVALACVSRVVVLG